MREGKEAREQQEEEWERKQKSLTSAHSVDKKTQLFLIGNSAPTADLHSALDSELSKGERGKIRQHTEVKLKTWALICGGAE